MIAQVPGSLSRSSPIHGVVESFLKSKKYIVPSAVVSPIFAGCVFAVYVGTGAGRFEPDHDAMVFNPDGVLESPLSRADRKTYRRQLKSLLAEWDPAGRGLNAAKQWEKLQSKAEVSLDSQGEPFLQFTLDGKLFRVGASTGNVAGASDGSPLAKELLAARLDSELRYAPSRGLSPSALARDWRMLQQAQRSVQGEHSQLSATAFAAPDHSGTNAP